jgi:peptide/nickel transport system ATP-binding protein
MSNAFLSVEDLVVHFPTVDGIVKATDGLSYELEKGKTLGIVGESGSGKSVSSSAIMGLHRGTNAKVSGRIVLDGTDLLTLSDEAHAVRRGHAQAARARGRDDLSGPAVLDAPVLHRRQPDR